MRYREKLKLLDNYIELSRILLKCKSMVMLKTNVDAEQLDDTCNLALKLKNICIERIKECGMYDESFLVLKKDIDTAVHYNIYPHNLNISTLNDMKASLSLLQAHLCPTPSPPISQQR